MLKNVKLLSTGILMSMLLVACDEKPKEETPKGETIEETVKVDGKKETTIGKTEANEAEVKEESKVNERTKVEVTEMLVRETLGEYNAGVGKSFLIIKYTITNNNDLPLKVDSLIKNAQVEHVYMDGVDEVREVFDIDPEAHTIYLETEGKNEETIEVGTELAVGSAKSSQYVFKIDTSKWKEEGHDYNLLLNGSSAKINN